MRCGQSFPSTIRQPRTSRWLDFNDKLDSVKTIAFISMLCFVLVACKKDELVGDYEILQGKWEWIGTTKEKTSPYYPDSIFWISAANHNHAYHIEFEKRGKVSICRNDTEVRWYNTNVDRHLMSKDKYVLNEEYFRISLSYNETKIKNEC